MIPRATIRRRESPEWSEDRSSSRFVLPGQRPAHCRPSTFERTATKAGEEARRRDLDIREESPPPPPPGPVVVLQFRQPGGDFAERGTDVDGPALALTPTPQTTSPVRSSTTGLVGLRVAGMERAVCVNEPWQEVLVGILSDDHVVAPSPAPDVRRRVRRPSFRLRAARGSGGVCRRRAYADGCGSRRHPHP
jgi:hypothetical protein